MALCSHTTVPQTHMKMEKSFTMVEPRSICTCIQNIKVSDFKVLAADENIQSIWSKPGPCTCQQQRVQYWLPAYCQIIGFVDCAHQPDIEEVHVLFADGNQYISTNKTANNNILELDYIVQPCDVWSHVSSTQQAMYRNNKAPARIQLLKLPEMHPACIVQFKSAQLQQQKMALQIVKCDSKYIVEGRYPFVESDEHFV